MPSNTKCLWVAESMEVPSNIMIITPLSVCKWFGKLKMIVSRVSKALDVSADQVGTTKQ